MVDTPSNNINFMALMNPQFAANQQALARQQLMAQEILKQGDQPEDINKLANPGGFVVPYSPVQGLSHALQKGVGAYMQQELDKKQLENYQALAGQPAMGTGDDLNTPAPQAVGNAMTGGASDPMMKDPTWIWNAATGGADNATKVWLAQHGPTDQMKNAGSGNPLVTNPMVKEGLIEGGKNYINLPTAAPSQPIVSTAPKGNPAITLNTPDGQQAVKDLGIDRGIGEPSKPVILTGGKDEILPPSSPVDLNSSAAIKGAETAATKAGGGDITDIQKKAEGQRQISQVVTELGKAYDDLDKKGGAVNTKNSAYENLAAFTGNSPIGQAYGKVTGTDVQSTRNTIIQKIPALINAIRQATGMSAKNMDSNTELQFYLKMATDPTVDIQSNKRALNNIMNMYGAQQATPISENTPSLEELVAEANKRIGKK